MQKASPRVTVVQSSRIAVRSGLITNFREENKNGDNDRKRNPCPVEVRSKARDLRVLARHRLRVVRLLPLRLTRRDHREAVLRRRQSDERLHLRAAGLCRGLRGPAVRRTAVRPSRRSGGPQVHLPDHHPDHGSVDFPGRPAAVLRVDRHCRADPADRPASVAGPGARRRVRWCRDLRRRALARRQSRLFHRVDPDHGHTGPVPLAAGDSRLPPEHDAGGFREVGLAHSVPRVLAAARDLGLHPLAAERVAAVPADEERGQDLEGAVD